ncbi:WD40 repeat domain-containing protein [Mycetohabitans endofungorum]|uniref:WD40 repeat domain-containing protein n=1 Tax=Mycetohabitans endofungorum TaxID=417203 RepID=UPI002B05C1E5|nr:hypothetical protein [Mycetohabitans endofungorum]
MEDQSQQNPTAPKHPPVEHDAQQLTLTQSLKEKFSEGHIPTQQDFSDLIDMASVGYAAVGTQPDGSKKPGPGLELDGNQRLSVKIDNSTSEGGMRGGLSIGPNGLSVAIDPSSGLQIDEEHRLTIAKDKLLSVNAFKQLSKADRQEIYKLLLDSYKFDGRKKLITSDMAENDRLYTTNLAISGDGQTLLIGTGDFSHRKSTYVFVKEKGEWKEKQRLTTSTGDAAGRTIAISDDGQTLLVGAFADGAAYVFTKEGEEWKEAKKLTTSGGEVNDIVAISGDAQTLILGSLDYYKATPAYVFIKEGTEWKEKQKLVASGNYVKFCKNVAISGNGQVMLMYADEYNIHTAVAYVFIKEGEEWKEKQRLVMSDAPGAGDEPSGIAMSSNGQILVVGVLAVNGDDGVAYVFIKEGEKWEEKQKLVIPRQGFFGPDYNCFSVSGNGQKIFLGTYMFAINGEEWEEIQRIQRLLPSDEIFGAGGVAVSDDGQVLLVGVRNGNSSGDNIGMAYIYE